MGKEKSVKSWLYGKLTDTPDSLKRSKQEELRKEARARAYRTESGMGGIIEASFVTRRPWRHEKSFWRKVGWVVYLSFFDREMSPVCMPLSLDEYRNGKLVILSSGAEIPRCGAGECVSLAHAYFDPYAH